MHLNDSRIGKSVVPCSRIPSTNHSPCGPCSRASRSVGVWELLRLRHVLEPEDVWPPPRSLSCKEVGLRAATLWANELKRPHPSLSKTLLRMGWGEAIWFWNWSFAVAVGWIATPIFPRVFLSELAGDRDLSTLIGYGVGYLFFIIAFSIANCKWQAQVLGLKLRTATQRLIYHSCLFLPVDSLNGITSPAKFDVRGR